MFFIIFSGRQRKVDRRGWRCRGVGDGCRDRAFAFAVAVGDGPADLGFLWGLWAVVLAPVAVGVHDVIFASKDDCFWGVAHDWVLNVMRICSNFGRKLWIFGSPDVL